MKKGEYVQLYQFIIEFHRTFGGQYAKFDIRHTKIAEFWKVTATLRGNEDG